MNFPPFWAKGSHKGFWCWRWSAHSLGEAQSLAQDAARKLAERFAAGDTFRNRYPYADRPLREPVLRELKSSSGEVAAVITRNSYGCLVLNTARVMFVDVDLPEPKVSVGGLLKKLFGKPEPPPANASEAAIIAKAEAWGRRHPDWGWRVYRTRAGLRFLATHALFDPATVDAEPVFDELGADPLYRRLCATQKCYRARLTPKPWRCGLPVPPARWPWPDAKAEEHFKKWESRYLAAGNTHATCALVKTLGNRQVHADALLVVGVHDEVTRAGSKLPLA